MPHLRIAPPQQTFSQRSVSNQVIKKELSKKDEFMESFL